MSRPLFDPMALVMRSRETLEAQPAALRQLKLKTPKTGVFVCQGTLRSILMASVVRTVMKAAAVVLIEVWPPAIVDVMMEPATIVLIEVRAPAVVRVLNRGRKRSSGVSHGACNERKGRACREQGREGDEGKSLGEHRVLRKWAQMIANKVNEVPPLAVPSLTLAR
jgi:hypothetical protein